MIIVAQAGVGEWGANVLRNFFGLQDCAVKICCDKDAALLKKVSSRYHEKIETTTNFDDLLNDPAIEGIAIATPASTHFQLASKALKAGKHVFVEKPLALNVQDGEDLVKAAEDYKRILMVGHLLLYHPAVRKLKQYIDDGALGDIYYIYSTRVNLGRIRSEENALWSLTAHDISAVLYFLGQEPVEVTAKGESYLRGGIEDVVFVTIKFKNRVMAHVHASWLDPHKMRKLTVVGNKKMAVFDDMETAEKIRIYDKGVNRVINPHTYEEFLMPKEGDIHIPKIDMMEPLKVECQHFIDCIKTGAAPMTDGENGLMTLRILDAAQRSMERKEAPVEWV